MKPLVNDLNDDISYSTEDSFAVNDANELSNHIDDENIQNTETNLESSPNIEDPFIGLDEFKVN